MKKGFSFIELAIVLVIIGIVMGMAMKGKQLIDIAHLQSEVARVVKIESGMLTYYAKYGKMPESQTPGTVYYSYNDDKEFIDSGVFTAKDLRSSLAKGDAYMGRSWSFVRCSPNSGSAGGFTMTYQQTGVCMVFRQAGQMPESLMCGIEASLDDQNLNFGSGRGYNISNTMTDFTNCIDRKEYISGTSGFFGYFYMILNPV